MAVKYRELDWQALVVQANPDHYRDLEFRTEFEFPAPPGNHDPRIHENGMRVFKGYYKQRGPYASE